MQRYKKLLELRITSYLKLLEPKTRRGSEQKIERMQAAILSKIGKELKATSRKLQEINESVSRRITGVEEGVSHLEKTVDKTVNNLEKAVVMMEEKIKNLQSHSPEPLRIMSEG